MAFETRDGVAYWLQKHVLKSQVGFRTTHKERALVQKAHVGVVHWLQKYGLRIAPYTPCWSCLTGVKTRVGFAQWLQNHVFDSFCFHKHVLGRVAFPKTCGPSNTGWGCLSVPAARVVGCLSMGGRRYTGCIYRFAKLTIHWIRTVSSPTWRVIR